MCISMTLSRWAPARRCSGRTHRVLSQRCSTTSPGGIRPYASSYAIRCTLRPMPPARKTGYFCEGQPLHSQHPTNRMSTQVKYLTTSGRDIPCTAGRNGRPPGTRAFISTASTAADFDPGGGQDGLSPPFCVCTVAALHEFDELHGVAGGAAGEAVEDALLGGDGHGCTAFAVDGAAHHLVAPTAFVQIDSVVGEDWRER